MTNLTTNLFDRVPGQIFRPLGGSEHARRNWSLLTHLYNEFFSPEAEPPESEGWSQKRVLTSIERFLIRWDDDQNIILEDKNTPIMARAHAAFKSLVESEWLSKSRSGFLQYVIMRPTVQSLFELLKTFAEQGPEFISGRVQSIHNNLTQVQIDPEANAAVFHVAALECSALLNMLNTTSLRVREASENWREEELTHVFLERFFGDYISSLYIGDYSDLFSHNHPLTARWEIIDIVTRIVDNPESRSKLILWYRKNMRCVSDDEAENLIDTDTSRFLALRNVDRLLRKLKDAVTKANSQALGYLEYKVRSQSNFGHGIDQTIEAILRTDNSYQEEPLMLPFGCSQGELLSEHALKHPMLKKRKIKSIIINKPKLSAEAQVRRFLRKIMKGNREVSEARIITFIEKHMPVNGVMESSSLKVESINDLFILITLSRIGINSERIKRNAKRGIIRTNPYPKISEIMKIELTGERFENNYIEAPTVKIRRISIGVE